MVAGPVALVAGESPSWVVTRTPSPSAASPAELVLGQRLGRGRGRARWRRAARAAPRARSDRGQGGQQVGQRLARRRAGGEHDVLPGVGGLGGDRLVAPRVVDAAGQRRPRTTSGCAHVGQAAVRRAARRAAPRGGVSRSSRPGAGGEPVDRLGHRRSASTRSTRPSTGSTSPDGTRHDRGRDTAGRHAPRAAVGRLRSTMRWSVV